jgi:hypothetical protein
MDIEVEGDIECRDFFDRICAAMSLDPANAQLGWKSNDDTKHGPARRLSTDADINDAFISLIKMKNNTRRRKEVVMQICDLVCLLLSYNYTILQ